MHAGGFARRANRRDTHAPPKKQARTQAAAFGLRAAADTT